MSFLISSPVNSILVASFLSMDKVSLLLTKVKPSTSFWTQSSPADKPVLPAQSIYPFRLDHPHHHTNSNISYL